MQIPVGITLSFQVHATSDRSVPFVLLQRACGLAATRRVRKGSGTATRPDGSAR